MKKTIVVLLICVLLCTSSSLAYFDGDILFRGIPYGTDYDTVCEMLPDFELREISGEWADTKPMEDIVWNRNRGETNYEFTDINIIGYATNKNIKVAGYQTEEINLYFAYRPVDGLLTHESKDSALYGATYTFDPVDIDMMEKDLASKLTSIYGQPDAIWDREVITEEKFTFYVWVTEAGDCGVVLGACHKTETSWLYDDEIWITYYTSEGETWLQEACDAERVAAIMEQEAISDNDTDGL